MPSLEAIEALFSRALEPTTPAEQQQAFIQLLQAADNLSPEQQIGIYRNNSLGALLAALKQLYPACLAIVGEPAFCQIGKHYIAKHPSTGIDLNHYGDRFAQHIGDWTKAHSAFHELPYLAELAQLEWLWNEAYFADAAPVLDPSTLEQAVKNPDKLRFRLNPGVALLECHFPVHAIWASHREGTPLSRIQALTQPDYLLIHRPQYQPEVSRIDAAPFRLLQRIQAGDSLAQLSSDTELAAAVPAIPGLLQDKIIGLSVRPQRVQGV